MRKTILIALFWSCLSTSTSQAAQQVPAQPLSPALANRSAMTNENVIQLFIQLLKSRTAPEAIVKEIQNRSTAFDLSQTSIVELNLAGATPAILAAMWNATLNSSKAPQNAVTAVGATPKPVRMPKLNNNATNSTPSPVGPPGPGQSSNPNSGGVQSEPPPSVLAPAGTPPPSGTPISPGQSSSPGQAQKTAPMYPPNTPPRFARSVSE